MSGRISLHEKLDVGDVVLHALVRGRENGPVVLLLQQGPGFPMLHEANALESCLGLEAHHRVVYLDQRGTGRSLAPDAPLSMNALVNDVLAVSRQLCARLRVDSIDIVGFSLGGTLALLAAQKDASNIRSVVAVGPDIDMAESEEFAWRFALEQALRRGKRGLAQRILIARDDTRSATAARFMARVRYVTDLGGIAIGQSFIGLLATTLLRLFVSPMYTIAEAVRALAAMQRTQATLLVEEGFAHLDIRGLSAIAVPAFIFQGRLDAAAPPFLAERFYEGLSAPRKALVWFDDCAHMPHFEAPAVFRAALHEALSAH